MSRRFCPQMPTTSESAQCRTDQLQGVAEHGTHAERPHPRPQTGSCSLTCASVAASVGLTALQLAFLNPQLTANSQRVCQVSLGQTLCRGAL